MCMQLAKEQGDFLLVGLHIDDDVMERRGAHLPIMDLHERSLSVLACRYVNEVIIGKPSVILHCRLQNTLALQGMSVAMT
jgi:ethanolamine-phosphate cytidylyltransferase